MTREELESRSKAELIDLALQQQTQIASLQLQLAQQLATRGNGAALEPAAAAGPEPGQFPRPLRAMLILSGVFACAILLLIANFRPNAQANVGLMQDYPPGSVSELFVPAPNRGEPAIPILIVNDPGAGLLALHGRDPGSNCRLRWDSIAERIEDPCSGSKYSQTGEYLEGPSPRGLDRYAVTVTDSGEVQVDVNRLQPGPPRP